MLQNLLEIFIIYRFFSFVKLLSRMLVTLFERFCNFFKHLTSDTKCVCEALNGEDITKKDEADGLDTLYECNNNGEKEDPGVEYVYEPSNDSKVYGINIAAMQFARNLVEARQPLGQLKFIFKQYNLCFIISRNLDHN